MSDRRIFLSTIAPRILQSCCPYVCLVQFSNGSRQKGKIHQHGRGVTRLSKCLVGLWKLGGGGYNQQLSIIYEDKSNPQAGGPGQGSMVEWRYKYRQKLNTISLGMYKFRMLGHLTEDLILAPHPHKYKDLLMRQNSSQVTLLLTKSTAQDFSVEWANVVKKHLDPIYQMWNNI